MPDPTPSTDPAVLAEQAKANWEAAKLLPPKPTMSVREALAQIRSQAAPTPASAPPVVVPPSMSVKDALTKIRAEAAPTPTAAPQPEPLPPGPERFPGPSEHPYLATAGRIVAPIAGRYGGAALGTLALPVTGPAGPVAGGLAGSALMSAATEPLWQKMEGRENINWAEAPVQGLLSALPALGEASTIGGTIAKQTLGGIAQGVTADVGLRLARGEPVDPVEAVKMGAFGGGLAGTAGGVQKALQSEPVQRAAQGVYDYIERMLPERVRPPITQPSQLPLREVGMRAEAGGEALKGLGERGQPPVKAPIMDMEQLRETGSRVMNQIGQMGRRAWDWYNSKPRVDSFDRILGERNYGINLSGAQLKDFSKDIKKIPYEWRRAMTAYHDLKGDPLAIQIAIDRAPTAALKRKYQNALALPDELKRVVDSARNYFDQMLQLNIDAGILDEGIEDYLYRVWSTRPNDMVDALRASANVAPLQPKPGYTFQRIFRDMNEAQIEERGFRSNDDYAYRLGHYNEAFERAMLDKKTIHDLFTTQASDGRPIVAVRGAGHLVGPSAEHSESALLVNPVAKPEDAQDYLSEAQMGIAVPQLRNWRWITKAPDGTPVLMRGEAVVHPEYAKRLSHAFGRSAVQTGKGKIARTARAALKLSTLYKQTMFSLSPFHQTTEFLHGAGHQVPLNQLFLPPPIDWTHADVEGLLKGGLMAIDAAAGTEFSEGLTGGGGLVRMVPGIGQWQEDYTNWLFQEYIPRLKMTMARDALNRNRLRYGNQLSPEQLYKLTANQANFAFGELNYAMMGMNPTLRDVLRLMFTAPDFNIARLGFLGQGLLPYNAEQRAALMRIGLSNYVTARIVNQVSDDNPHWSLSDIPFGYKIGETVYTPRTITGDAAHLIGNTRSWLYHRLNPTTVLPFTKAIFGDIQGQRQTMGEILSDTFTGIVPIPSRGLLNQLGLQDGDQNILQALISSFGISAYPYRDPVEKQVDKARLHLPAEREDPETRKERLAKLRVVEAMRRGETPNIKDWESLDTNQQAAATRAGSMKRFESKIDTLPLVELMKAYETAKSYDFPERRKSILREFASRFYTKSGEIKSGDPITKGVKVHEQAYARKMMGIMMKDLAEKSSKLPESEEAPAP